MHRHIFAIKVKTFYCMKCRDVKTETLKCSMCSKRDKRYHECKCHTRN